LFGGYAVYFLGIYSYGVTVTHSSERAFRLSRLDGIETFGAVIGTLLSPHIFKHLGYYGNYIISSGFFALAILYLILFVKEPIQKCYPNNKTNLGLNLNLKMFWKTAIVTPLMEMKSVFTKERTGIAKLIISSLVLSFGLYVFSIQAFRLTYLYMMLVFDGFTAAQV